jgi:hypothetical protein
MSTSGGRAHITIAGTRVVEAFVAVSAILVSDTVGFIRKLPHDLDVSGEIPCWAIRRSADFCGLQRWFDAGTGPGA